MNLEEILLLDFNEKNICIIGPPASGKTFLSNKICNKTHHKIHTDEFLKEGYFMGLHGVMNQLSFLDGKPTLVEGVIGYRLLRKGIELASYYADIVINCIISENKQRYVYLKERNPEKIKYLQTFNSVHQKIFEQYKNDCPIKKTPIFIDFINEY